MLLLLLLVQLLFLLSLLTAAACFQVLHLLQHACRLLRGRLRRTAAATGPQ
jgi:hypothetical protein